MRVLHYLPNEVRGGVEEHALSLLVSLRDFGIDPIMAAPRALMREMEAELSASGVEAVCVEPFSPLDPVALMRLARTIRCERVDVVHCHMFGATLRAAPAARLAGVHAVVETCHGPEAWRFGKVLKGRFWIDRLTATLVDRYVAVSHAAARHLSERKRIPASKITVIHNGRDLSRFHPATEAERAHARASLGLRDEKAILLLGRLHPQKGHEVLLKALALLAPRRPGLLALFAGDGPLRDKLGEQARATRVAERVHFLGFRSDIQALLAACDLVVLPSLYEGLPLVAIEALAAARPIVATAVDGTPEVVIGGETGLLVPPADPQALARAIERLLGSESEALRLAANGRAWVKREFDLSEQIERTVAVYRELSGRAQRVSPTLDRPVLRRETARIKDSMETTR